MGAAGTPIGNMVIKLGLDDADFGRGVENSKKQVKYLAKEMQANMKIADMAGSQLDKFGARFNGLTTIIGAQEKQVAALKKAYDESFVDGKATDSTKRLAAQLQDANGKLAGYKQQIINTAGSLAELEVKTTGATGAIYAGSEKMISAGKQMESVGGSLTKGLTLPILAGAAAVTTAAISWESAFAGVKKTNDEVVDSTGKVVYSYKDLEDGLRGLAKELPSSHQEIAAVAEAAGQLGIETPNVVGFTKTMIDLGESTNMSAETAATALARFANITQMSQSDFDRLGSVIVDLGNNFATTESEITEMGLRLAGAGKQIGMSEGDILGFAAALSSVGIEAEAGGSAFSKVMIQMQLAVEKGTGAFSELEQIANNAGYSIGEIGDAVLKGGKPLKSMAESLGMNSKELSKMYKEADKSKTSLEDFAQVAGMTGEQFSQAFKDDPSQAIIKFIEGLKNAESQGTSAIKVLDDMGITEVRLRDSLLRASNASNVFSGAIEMGNKAWGENTALTEEANKRYETTESKLKMLKNEVIDSAIELGGPFVDALRDGLQASKPLVKMLGDLAKAFSDADPKTQRMVVSLLAATAAAGPLLSITGKLTGGIGSLGKSFVELSASMAKKKAITEATEALASGAISTKEFSSAMAGGVSNVTKFGSAAASASGASGIGAMTAALGPLGPAILGIVGVGGALAIGYGAWKLFGEEAWNSSQRVQRWGTDVGQATDETLLKVQENTQLASGQFGLMVQGFETDSGSMVANFEKIGQAIENDLTNKLETYKKAVELLPTELQGKASEILGDYNKETQKTLELIKQNNEEVLNIKKSYVDKDGEITVQGSKMIQDLMKQSTEEYLKIAVDDADARKEVMTALSGDVKNATEEQAEAWIKSLAKQRQATKANYTEEIDAYRKKLEDTEQLSKKEIDMLVGLYEDARETSTDALDAQMAMIVKKYPELAKKISLANGQMIDAAGNGSQAMIKENQKIIDKAEDLASKLSETAKKNADAMRWTADQTTAAGKTWNSLELLDKEGKVKTNANQIVTEAAKDTSKWNSMKLLIHDANLDSNAKLVIGEAAIATGRWDSLIWEEKQAILNNKVSETVVKALEDSGKWKEMSFEQKKAILYSNTPEVMTETMLNLGLWKDYQPAIKELKAENYNFLNAISGSEEKMNHWNGLPADIKEIIGDNYDFLEKIYSSDTAFARWNGLPDSEKKILAENTDFLNKILTSETNLNRWNSLPAEQKSLLANNEDLLNKVFASESAYSAWSKLPDNIKRMLGDNSDLNAKIADGTLKLEEYKANEPGIKTLLGDAAPLINQTTIGEAGLNSYKNNNPAVKNLMGNASNVNNATSQGNNSLNIFAANNPAAKYLNALDQASGPASAASQAVQNFASGDPVITKTLRVVADVGANVGQAMRAMGLEKGTNYHLGGPAIVNDQSGPLYKELILPKGGTPFIAEGRDVLLPNLPKGSKVLNARQTKQLLPHYADGVGVPENSSIIRNLKNHTNNSSDFISNQTIVTQDYNNKFDELISIMSKFGKDLKNLTLEVDKQVMGTAVTETQTKRKAIIKTVRGGGK